MGAFALAEISIAVLLIPERFFRSFFSLDLFLKYKSIFQ